MPPGYIQIYTHTHIQTRRGYTQIHRRSSNLMAFARPLLLSVLIDLVAYNLSDCMCVCECVQAPFSSIVPATIQWQTNKLPYIALYAVVFASQPKKKKENKKIKETNLFREWQLVQSFSPNNEKCVGWATAKTTPIHPHTHTYPNTQTHS